jgi:hypothetical protein
MELSNKKQWARPRQESEVRGGMNRGILYHPQKANKEKEIPMTPPHPGPDIPILSTILPTVSNVISHPPRGLAGQTARANHVAYTDDKLNQEQKAKEIKELK